jgi:hypothetical protein
MTDDYSKVSGDRGKAGRGSGSERRTASHRARVADNFPAN